MFKFLNLPKFKYQGFTLIEIITAMTLFVFLTMAALGVYLTSVIKHREALRSQTVNEDLQYATEVIYRDIKDGHLMALSQDRTTIYIDHLTKNITGDDCTNLGGTSCEKCSQADGISCNCCLQYKFNSNDDKNRIEVKAKGDSDFVALTSSRTSVEIFDFYIPVRAPGEADYDEDQPRITILIKAREKNDTVGSSEITLQTTVVQLEVLNFYQGTIL